MTEAEWATCTEPGAMLRFLTTKTCYFDPPWLPSDRKIRLFVCGAVRNSGLAPSTWAAQAIVVAEKVADALTRPTERGLAFNATDIIPNHLQRFVSQSCLRAIILTGAIDMVAQHPSVMQAALFRCIIGNPRRPLVREKAYLTDARTHAIVSAAAHTLWEEKGLRSREGDDFHRRAVNSLVVRDRHVTDTARMLAEAAYRDREPDGTLDAVLLAAVADSLEEAGMSTEQDCDCLGGWKKRARVVKPTRDDIFKDNTRQLFAHPLVFRGSVKDEGCERCDSNRKIANPVLAHLRSPGPHYRGCHVIDLLLGKE